MAVATELEYGLFINGELVEPVSGELRDLTEPATGAPLARAAMAGREDVDRAVDAARAALEGPWAKTPPPERSRLLHALADAIHANRKELTELETRNVGKALSNVKGEVATAVENFRFFASALATIAGRSHPIGGSILFYSLKEPVGVCAQIVPWNYPIMMTAWKLAPALAAGCTVVLKPDPATPLTALRVAELAAEVGIPPGVVNIVPGDGPTTGAYLVSHPGVDKVAFTGSTKSGSEVMRLAAEPVKRISLELGGKSPNLVFADANLDDAIPSSVYAIYYSAGQSCDARSRVLVERPVYDEFVARFTEAAGRLAVGDPLSPETQMGSLISQAHREKVHGFVETGRDEGAEVVVGGRPNGEGPNGGYFVSPTLFTGVRDEMRIAREEIFGPVLVAMPFEDLDEVAARANDTEYGLAAGLWTRDISNAHKLAAKLEAGNVYINTWGGGDPAAPFGGYKASGIGREKGHHNLDAYLETKTVWTQL